VRVYISSQKLCHTAAGNSHAIWDHTVLRYLPPGRGENPTFAPSWSRYSI